MKQMAAAAVRKMRCCKRSSLLVVTLDCNGLRIFLSLEIDDRNFQIMKLFNLHIAACHHNAGYTVGDEHIEIFGFFLRLIFRVAEQNLVAPLCRRALECTDHFTEKRVRDVRNDNPDRIGMRFCQGTRQLIRLVIHLLHRLRYFFSCLFTDVSAVVDHAGNRRRRNAGACRYVLDCRHVSLLIIF